MYGNHVEVAWALVEVGADVDVKDDTVQSAYLIAASEVGDDPVLPELTLDTGADADADAEDSYNGTGLIRAADRGFAEILRRLLATDLDVDHVNRLGWTALLEAVILGDGGPRHTEVVRLLAEGGVGPEHRRSGRRHAAGPRAPERLRRDRGDPSPPARAV